MRRVAEKVQLVGVDCPTCVYAVQKRLASLGCVERFDVDASTGLAIVVYDADRCRTSDLYEAVRDAGYDVVKSAIALVAEDVHDWSRIEDALESKPGVFDVRVSPATGVVKIVYNPLALEKEALAREFKELGLELRLIEEGVSIESSSYRVLLARRGAAFAIGVSALGLALASSVLAVDVDRPELMLALSATVLILVSDVLARGLRALWRLSPTMESFIALSTLTSFAAGVATLAGLLGGEPAVETSVFFEASAGIGGFVSAGLLLEERLKARALRQLEEATRHVFGRARVVRDGALIDVEASDVKPGEVVVVKAGEVIPVDGVVVEGWGYVDESNITGEPAPRFKKGESRDPVFAGSVLLSGYIEVRATRCGKDTVLSLIAENVREAQFYKPRTARLADRVLRYLTWVVMGAGLATALYWLLIEGSPELSVLFAAAVFAVACPCALGIAIPLATSVAIIRASRLGILVKRGDVFERVLEASLVLFDKTGTITRGEPRVQRVYTLGVASEETALLYACSVEKRSEHPLAKSILRYCEERGLDPVEPESYEHIPGMGVVGRVGGAEVAVGSIELARGLGVELDREVEDLVKTLGSRGATPVLVLLDRRVCCVIEVSDSLREEALMVVEELKKVGVKTGIASGDVPESVEYYARRLKVDFAFSQMKPEDKLELVRALEAQGYRVIFVGDGVNDAPALSGAFLGIAMGGGANLAKISGDVVLLREDLRDLLTLLRLSRVVRSVYYQNLAWAFVYNAMLIPVAMGVLYEPYGLMLRPELAALAMILSDISVILNSTTLMVRRI